MDLLPHLVALVVYLVLSVGLLVAFSYVVAVWRRVTRRRR